MILTEIENRMENLKIQHKIPNPEKFTLHLKGNKDSGYKISDKLQNGILIKKFGSSVTKKHPKIYVVLSEEKIVYVGYTSDSITNRLRSGLNPANKSKANTSGTDTHGYSGYKWRGLQNVELLVFVFNGFEIPVSKAYKLMFENIEAELVHQIKSNGDWPKYQSEIHFYSDFEHNDFSQKPVNCYDLFGMSLTEVAKKMLESI
jgi:hypothetical protein